MSDPYDAVEIWMLNKQCGAALQREAAAEARALKYEQALVREKYAYEVAQEQRTHFQARALKYEQALRVIAEHSKFDSDFQHDVEHLQLIARAALDKPMEGK